MIQAEKLIDINAVSELVNLPVKTLYQYVQQKRLPVLKISSRCLRFRLSDIMLWLESKSQGVQEAPMPVRRSTRRPRKTTINSRSKNHIDALVESVRKEVLS